MPTDEARGGEDAVAMPGRSMPGKPMSNRRGPGTAELCEPKLCLQRREELTKLYVFPISKMVAGDVTRSELRFILNGISEMTCHDLKSE